MTFKQSGFSLLHVLPLVAIVAVIAVVGVKVLGNSSAAVAYPSCSTKYTRSGTYVGYSTTFLNTSYTVTTSSIGYQVRKFGSVGNTFRTGTVPSLKPRTSSTISGGTNFIRGQYGGVQVLIDNKAGYRVGCGNSLTYYF
jgi:hypothetical protein